MAKKTEPLKKATILHNPLAGAGETSKRELLDMMALAGFKCSYSSTKDGPWEIMESSNPDILILAGGDGTVRKIAAKLLKRKLIEKKLPIGLLPMGTANNIAKTLALSGKTKDLIHGWREGRLKKFDVGDISGLKKPAFFLESFGYGLFPKLMNQMKLHKQNDIEDAEIRLTAALKLLQKLIASTPVKKCTLNIDQKDYSGKFLLIEVMNIRSIGPNLQLAPDADPGDGEFDVVLITENQRDALAAYVAKKLQGVEVPFDFPLLKAKKLDILWDGKHVHVDDEYHYLDKPRKIKIELRPGVLNFLLSGEETSV